jgi:ubiquinol-cytochrome c reductase cytochrome b subunit
MRTLRALGDWVNERTGLRAAVRAWVDAPAVAMDVGSQLLGAVIAACFGVLVLTGIVLMSNYGASPQSAWASVHYLQFIEPHGWIVRGIHYWAAQVLLVASFMHILYGAVTAAYRPRRELVWWLTLLVAGLSVGQSISGGLLPWDQRGWWARTIEANILGLTPVLGAWAQRMVCGGVELGALGLARAYAAHVLALPLLLATVLWARHALALRYGRLRAAPTSGVTSRVEQLGPAVAVAVTTTFAIFAVTAGTRGAPLDAPADPTSDYLARPEWFLLSLYELRKFFHGAAEFWALTLIPGAVVGYLVALPWLDRPPRAHIIVLAPVMICLGAAVLLGIAAYRHDARDPIYAKMRGNAQARAVAAVKIAMRGVPPAGALDMVRNDPELRGHDLFEAQCASCHVLDGLGDPAKATAAKLDGWGTAEWIEAMMHEPDARHFFGNGPYAQKMPSVDVRPTDSFIALTWTAMVKGDIERHAVAVFLANEGNEPEDGPRQGEHWQRVLGEKVVRSRCSSCHPYKGDGDLEGSGFAPELSRYGSIAWTIAQVANPATPQTYRDRALDPAMKKHMPRFDRDLSPADVDLVSRWTRAHARGIGPLP